MERGKESRILIQQMQIEIEDEGKITSILTVGYLGIWPNTVGIERRDAGGIKRQWRPVSPQLVFNNKYSILQGQNKMDLENTTKRDIR